MEDQSGGFVQQQVPPPGGQMLKPHRGAVVLVLGILGIVVCVICAIIAWVMAKNDLREMDAGIMDPTGRDLTNAGKICGIIGTILGIIGAIFGILWMILVAGLAASGGMR